MLTPSQRAKATAIGRIGAPVAGALARTWKWRAEGSERYDELRRAGRVPIFAFWHGRILPGTVFWRDRGIVAMASENFDGEWIARLIERFGYRAARGSSSRGGARALVQLRRELSAGHAVAFTIDGPRGPARVAQPGAVWLAGATGQPLLPFHIETDRCWTVNSWDRTMVPKAFSTVTIAVGEPMDVGGTDEALVEQKRVELEQRLAALERRSLDMLGRAEARTACC